MASVKLAEVEAFIAENDPFTKTRMMRTLGISSATAEKSIHDLLDLGVIRILDPRGARKYYTKAQIGRALTDPSRIEERQLEFLQEISRSPKQIAELFGARHYVDYVRKIEALLERASPNHTVRLSIVYAIERDLIKEIRSRR